MVFIKGVLNRFRLYCSHRQEKKRGEDSATGELLLSVTIVYILLL